MVLLVFGGDLSFGRKDDRLSWLIYEGRFSLMGMFFEESGVIVRGPDECVGLDADNGGLFIFPGFFQSLHQLPNGFAGPDMTVERRCAGLLYERGRVTTGERQNAAHPSLADTPLLLEEKIAKFPGLGTDLFRPLQKALRHPGRIEDPVGISDLYTSGPPAFDVPSNERERFLLVDLDLKIVDPNDHLTEDRGGQGRVEGSLHLDAPVVPDGARLLFKIPERLEGQFFKMRLLLQKHLLDLPLGPAVNSERGPTFFPVHQPFVLSLDGLELAALQGGVLGVLDGVLDGPLPVGVGNTRRIGDDAVKAKHGGIDGI